MGRIKGDARPKINQRPVITCLNETEVAFRRDSMTIGHHFNWG